jgi:hypothetical protein
MRDSASSDSQPVSGGAHRQPVDRIRVRWEFLGVSLAALVAGVVFGVLEMRETRRVARSWGVWKGSSLATLACGLDEVSRGRLRVAGEEGRLGEEARVLRVAGEEGRLGEEARVLRVRLEGRGLVLRPG